MALQKNQMVDVKPKSMMKSIKIKTQRNIRQHHMMTMMFLSRARISIMIAKTSPLTLNQSQKL